MSSPRPYWRFYVVGIGLFISLMLPHFGAPVPTATVHADEPNPTPTLTATPEDWGGQGDDDDM